MYYISVYIYIPVIVTYFKFLNSHPGPAPSVLRKAKGGVLFIDEAGMNSC